MNYVVDTHPLVWHLEGNPRLPRRVADVLAARIHGIVVPSIVIAEAWYLYNRQRIVISPQELQSRILSAANCSVHPLDETVIDLLPAGLEIHDAIIVATALVSRDVLGQPTQLITGDKKITESKLIEVLW